jgi:hypothetical protein
MYLGYITMSVLTPFIPSLKRELLLIQEMGWDPKYCKKKLEAALDGDVEEYCDAFEEELAVKVKRVEELLRIGGLTATLLSGIEKRIDGDRALIAKLRAEIPIEEFHRVLAPSLSW